MDQTKLYIYDIETYEELFSFSIIRSDGKHKKTFECSKFLNEIDGIFKCLDYLHNNDCYLVGFNSNQFDWPVVQELVDSRDNLPKTGKGIASKVFKIAQKQIESFRGEGFGNTIKFEEQYVKQLDLFKIHHFDNKAKMTSLKLIEFNMKMATIEDLPYDIRSSLTKEMIDKIKSYNEHDVEATRLFFHESLSQVEFRFQLTEKYSRNFLNHNDGKIGKDYFQMRLEESGVKLHTYKDGKKVIKQSKRPKINIGECLFEYYDFKFPEFIALKDWFSKQTITETKGVFSDIEEHDLGELAKYSELTVKRKKFKSKPSDSEIALFKKEHRLGWVEEEELKATEWLLDAKGDFVFEQPEDEFDAVDFTKKPKKVRVPKKPKKVRVPKKSYWGCWKVAETLNVVIDGLRIDFGTGGVHASRQDVIVNETRMRTILDLDVSSQYPNLAIANRVYPEHLGEGFCDIYQDVYEQRKSYPKGSSENGMLKLALNSVYGDSNNKFSVFYDPMYTMKITINGQLSILLLAEKLLAVKGLRLIQLNTDGITCYVNRDTIPEFTAIHKDWEKQVGLQLESCEYSKMILSNVNSYIALYTNGKVKRKGMYQYEDLEWHKNHSSLVIPMAAEAQMLHCITIREFIENHAKNPDNKWDFMLRTKVPRSSKLYMVMEDGTEIQQQNVCRYYPCKKGGKLVKVMPPLEEGGELRRLSLDKEWNVKTCNNIKDFGADIDLDYYISEAQKLLIQ